MSERVRGAAGGATAGSLASILPDDVEVEEAIHLSSVGLLADEEPFVARFAPRRLAEFVSGRACARRALVALGVPDALRRAIPVGAHGQPVWPAGVVGSITHCPGRCAAVAAPSDRYRSIGIDRTHLPRAVIDSTAHHFELAGLDSDYRVEWPLVLFSARESVFKCWFPLVGGWLDHLDVEIEVDTSTRKFRVAPAVPMSPDRQTVLSAVVGSFTWTAEHVCAAAWVPQDRGGNGMWRPGRRGQEGQDGG